MSGLGIRTVNIIHAEGQPRIDSVLPTLVEPNLIRIDTKHFKRLIGCNNPRVAFIINRDPVFFGLVVTVSAVAVRLGRNGTIQIVQKIADSAILIMAFKPRDTFRTQIGKFLSVFFVKISQGIGVDIYNGPVHRRHRRILTVGCRRIRPRAPAVGSGCIRLGIILPRQITSGQ